MFFYCTSIYVFDNSFMITTYFKHDTSLHVLDMKEKVMTGILYQSEEAR